MDCGIGVIGRGGGWVGGPRAGGLFLIVKWRLLPLFAMAAAAAALTWSWTELEELAEGEAVL